MAPDDEDLALKKAFIRANTRLGPVDGLTIGVGDLQQTLQIWQADEITPIWAATEDDLARQGLEPPFWAFPWAGGQAVARLVLARPELVRGKRVLDIACGSGMVGIAVASAGAEAVLVNDIDPICRAAAELNAQANGVALRWLGAAAGRGIAAYAGDPGRAYAPRCEAGLMAEYDIATTMELESTTLRHARVWQIGVPEF